MANEVSRRRRSPWPLLLPLLGGLYLIYLAIPQTIGGVILIADDRTLVDVQGRVGRRVDATPLPELNHIIARWWRASAWLDNTDTWTSTGDLLMTAARESLKNEAVRNDALRLARTAYRNALLRSPANPLAWCMLATAEFELGGGVEQVVPLLEMSLETGRHETILVMTRLDLAFDFWGDLDSQSHAEIDDQVRIAAKISPDQLARLTQRHFMFTTVRTALSLDPDLLARFDEAFAKL